MRALVGILLLSACAAPREIDRTQVRDPEGLHRFYTQSVDAGRYGDLYRVTRVDLSQDEFIMIFLNADMMRECIRDTRLDSCVVDGEAGEHRLVNEEFAFDRTFAIRLDRRGYWVYEFTDDDVAYLRDTLWRYYDERPARYNGRRHVFPGGWRHTRVDSRGGSGWR